MTARPKLLTLERTRGTLLVSADLHGELDDFLRLRDIFLQLLARGADPVWVGLGDWVHGPDRPLDEPRSQDGVPLYQYPDRTAELVRALFALEDEYPGRVFSLCGNHEWAHLGGPRTRKFHDDEAAFLESQLAPSEVEQLRARFASWPIAIRVPSVGLLLSHGALTVGPEGAAAFDELDLYNWRAHPDAMPLITGMTHYGYSSGADRLTLARLSPPGRPPLTVVVHGHDRSELGLEPSGDAALLLCTSFGAPRGRKSYLRFDFAEHLDGPHAIVDGVHRHLLWG